ncbi:unnamed protein product [Kluyveromyces dobzhanskii CBS 2104]|uniref:WGS project CCBQ000000000 data, contig 00058 n=1 Tax=Kluyveromyces dobzhanskii CBS 2104 TaxID=1427455 RepID=A0A0A8LDF0_9SACH|nr:unnamed protein product [Kluyveromyces dobzhanskii CBS 2104]
MNKIKSISSTLPKAKLSPSSYDQSYLSLLRETLRDEIQSDSGSSKLLNDSTRAFLNSTWYKDSEKNSKARKDVLSLPAVSSYIDVLQRERNFKQACYMLNLIKKNKIEWVKPSGQKLNSDELGIPEELYFSFNKIMTAMTSNRLSNQDVFALAQYNFHLLDKYCKTINSENPSISFVLRTLGIITKGKSLIMIEEAIQLVFMNVPQLTKIQRDTIQHMTMLRFYQETDQRTKLIAHFRQHIQNNEILPLFAVRFELERFIERFLISGDETSASIALKKYMDLGFELRQEDIVSFSSLVHRNMLKCTNKLLLESFPEHYSPMNNTLSLNDVEDCDIETVLEILNASNINFLEGKIDLDYLITKVPRFDTGEGYYLYYKDIMKPEFNIHLKSEIFGLFLKETAGLGFGRFFEFLESAFADDETVSLFVAKSVPHNRFANFHAFFPALATNVATNKVTSLFLFNFLKSKSYSSMRFTPFDYSVLLNNSSKGHTHQDFYFIYYHFLKQHCKGFLRMEGSSVEFCFPASINLFLSTAVKVVGPSVLEIQSKILKFFERNGIDTELPDEVLQTAMAENFVPTCSSDEIEEIELEYAATHNISAGDEYNITNDRYSMKRLKKLLHIIDQNLTS